MKLQARFKTSSREIKKKKTGEYNFWSVVSLIVDAMSASESESLTEGIFDVIKYSFLPIPHRRIHIHKILYNWGFSAKINENLRKL